MNILRLCFIICLFSQLTFASGERSQDRPKIGLVLSGGGAKGFAHVGVIKMLDSLQIPIDYIAGTSMGGITGALYSIGYNGIQLEKLAHRTDWNEIFTDKPPRVQLPYFQKKDTGKYQLEFFVKKTKPVTPSGLIYGQKVLLLFTSFTFPYENITDFNHLPIPFRCVAVDLVTGNEVVLHSGSLAKAMRSTMAIPTVFSAVEFGDSLLVDGGLINNLPVDVVKAMGADIVIAVDVESPLRDRSKLNSAIDVLNQTIGLLGLEKKKKNLQQVDILIQPNLEGFNVADFDNDKITKIISRGDQAAREKLNELVALKEKYRLHLFHDVAEIQFESESAKVIDIQITGYRTVPFIEIYHLLKIKPGDFFDTDKLNGGIAEIKATGLFEKITYEIIPISDKSVRLFIRLQETQKPIIHRVDIIGNTNLPFSFIYKLIGLKAGDRLDVEKLNQRIMEIYGLGYFEHLEYCIESVPENRIILHFSVKELPLRRIRVGLRYEYLYKLVAVVSAQTTNLFMPGIRFENEFQFAGLQKYSGRISYPSRALNMPVYPFLCVGFKDIPTTIFNGDGSKIATYKDRSARLGIGMGFLLTKFFNVEIQYQHEYMNIKPEIAMPDEEMFPSWEEELHKIEATVNFDYLDDVLVPRRGVQIFGAYESSLKKLKSEASFSKADISGDFYFTFFKRNTFRLYGFYGESSKRTPIYKYFNKGRPYFFAGMNYDQLFALKMKLARFDYRYEFKKDIFFSVIANVAFDAEMNFTTGFYKYHKLWGAGIGVKLISPIGPIDIIFSRGSKSVVGKSTYQNVVYFMMGYKF